jgi:hypothetical protein
MPHPSSNDSTVFLPYLGQREQRIHGVSHRPRGRHKRRRRARHLLLLPLPNCPRDRGQKGEEGAAEEGRAEGHHLGMDRFRLRRCRHH